MARRKVSSDQSALTDIFSSPLTHQQRTLFVSLNLTKKKGRRAALLHRNTIYAEVVRDAELRTKKSTGRLRRYVNEALREYVRIGALEMPKQDYYQFTQMGYKVANKAYQRYEAEKERLKQSHFPTDQDGMIVNLDKEFRDLHSASLAQANDSKSGDEEEDDVDVVVKASSRTKRKTVDLTNRPLKKLKKAELIAEVEKAREREKSREVTGARESPANNDSSFDRDRDRDHDLGNDEDDADTMNICGTPGPSRLPHMAPFVPPLTPDMSSPVRGPHPRRVAFALPPSASATAPVTPAPASAPRSPMSPPPTQPRVPTHPAQLPTPQTLPHSPSPSQSSSVGRYHDALGDLSDIPAIPEDHDMPDVDMFDDSEIRMPGPDHDEDLAPLLVKIRSLEEELDGAKRHLSVKNTEIEDLRQQLAHMESFAAQRDHAEQRLRLIQADYIAGLHDRDALQARISEKEQALDEVRTHVRELEQTVARLSEVEREKAALAAERDALSAEIAQVKQDKADSQALCDAIKVRLDDSARDATTLRSDLAAARETTELYTRHLRAALEENSAKRDDILRLQNRFKESADDLEVARETTRVLEATVEEKETQAATWTARLAVLAAEMDELRTHLDESRRQTTLADSSLATMRRQLEDAVRKRTEETNALQFRLQKRQDELETARRKLTDAHAAVAAAATKMEQLERQLEEERAASAERQARDEARMHALEATIAKHDSNIATLTRDIRTMSTQLREREADLDASNAERARVSRLFEAEQATHNDTRKQKVILEGQLEETEDQLQTAKEMNEKMVNTWRSLIPGMTQMNGLVDDTAEPPRRTRSRRISDSGIGL